MKQSTKIMLTLAIIAGFLWGVETMVTLTSLERRLEISENRLDAIEKRPLCRNQVVVMAPDGLSTKVCAP